MEATVVVAGPSRPQCTAGWGAAWGVKERGYTKRSGEKAAQFQPTRQHEEWRTGKERGERDAQGG